MNALALLEDLFSRLAPSVERTLDGLAPEELVAQPRAGANTIGWLVWHMGRVQDNHVAELLGADQLWTSGEFAAGFGLVAAADDTGYGHSAEQVLGVRPRDTSVLLGYFSAVTARTREWLDTLCDDDLDTIVDRRFDPPVTMGVRLVSVADDGLEHAGQAAYVRGLLGR